MSEPAPHRFVPPTPRGFIVASVWAVSFALLATGVILFPEPATKISSADAPISSTNPQPRTKEESPKDVREQKLKTAKRAIAKTKQVLKTDKPDASDGRAPDPGFSDDLLVAWNTMQSKEKKLKVATVKYQKAIKAREAAAQAIADSITTEAEILTDTVTPAIVEPTPDPIADLLSDPPAETSAPTPLVEQPIVTGIEDAADPELLDQSEEAQDATQIAMEAYAEANDMVAALLMERVEATKNLQEAQIDYGEIATSPIPPQTTVGPDGCPTNVPSGGLQNGAQDHSVSLLCAGAIAQAATPQAAAAIRWAFTRLGAPYACSGFGRMDAYRFDCSSLVSRAYYESSGIPIAGENWALTTRQMMPWGGASLDPHLDYVAPEAVAAGDLLVYRSCYSYNCGYQHVVMYLGEIDGEKWILHTSRCGDVAKVEPFYGFDSRFVVARRVVHLDGEAPLRIAP